MKFYDCGTLCFTVCFVFVRSQDTLERDIFNPTKCTPPSKENIKFASLTMKHGEKRAPCEEMSTKFTTVF